MFGHFCVGLCLLAELFPIIGIPVYIIMREEPTRHWLQMISILKMAVTFTDLSWRLWSGKRHREPKISEEASVDSKADSSTEESETLEFPLVKNSSSWSGRMKPKWHNSWEEPKTDRECDVVLVPSDGECGPGSESDDSDWSIGWLEPHGPGLPNMDETDSSFAVLVPCYGRGYGCTVKDKSSNTLSNTGDFLDGYSDESMKSIDKWLSSLGNR